MKGLAEEIKEALEVLELPVLITQEDIKKQYYFLVKKYHPDRGGDEEKIRRINHAYKVLIQYIASFRYTFSDEEIQRQLFGDGYAQQFKA